MQTQLGSIRKDSKVKKKRFDSFEYVFHDFLEMKAEVDPAKAESLKTYLLSAGNKPPVIVTVRGFRADGELVLFEKEPGQEPRRIVFFNPEKGSFRVKELPS